MIPPSKKKGGDRVVQICYVCRQKYGEKEPLDDRTETHGVCPECWPGELKRVEDQIAKYRKECPNEKGICDQKESSDGGGEAQDIGGSNPADGTE